jgi:hypothetical protein
MPDPRLNWVLIKEESAGRAWAPVHLDAAIDEKVLESAII